MNGGSVGVFGYVRIAKSELKMGDYDRYQGVYCSLCHRLGKRYHPFMRWTLSYDFTCLALLGMALSEECGGFCKGHCVYNPLKKKLCCTDTTYVDYAADAAMLLVWYKLEDTICDDGFWKRLVARMARGIFKRSYRKAAALHPAWDEALARHMQEQAERETQKSGVDAAAEPSAQMLAMLAADLSDDATVRRVLDRLGYFLGRYVYLADALDDLEDDAKEGHFNPFLNGQAPYDMASIREYATQTLSATIAECHAAYELLPIRRFDAILRNILEWGMPLTVTKVACNKKERKRT